LGSKVNFCPPALTSNIAGIWVNHVHKQFDILEVGDLEEALIAAASIGDDRLQKQARGASSHIRLRSVVPGNAPNGLRGEPKTVG
jgi:hypothetical protein